MLGFGLWFNIIFREETAILILIVSLLLIVADQLIKWLAITHLQPITTYPIIEGILHLEYVENRGVAFGMLQNNKFISIGITGIMIGVIIYMVFSERIFSMFSENINKPFIKCTISIILAGGIGNFIDRIFRGYVVDYIYFVPINFPSFNLADVCITVGCILLLFYILFIEPKLDKNKEIK